MSDADGGAAGLLGDAARVVAASLSEIVPPEAQLHLLNAQRELLLAMAVIIEHNSGRRPRNPRGKRSRAPRKGAAPSSRRPKRVEID